MSTPTSQNWKAWQNTMPSSPPTLHVKGEVIVPTDGYSASLVRHVPQGINPSILIFDLVVVPPTGNAIELVSEIQVHYREETSVHYSNVTILPENTTIPVEIVS